MVIIDNTCLSSLHNIGHLDLLSYFFDTIVISRAVYNEFQVKYNEITGFTNYTIADPDIPIEKILSQFPTLQGLGKGDIQSIYLTKMDGSLLVTDDKKMRNIAKSMDIDFIGTLRLCKNGYLLGYFTSFNQYAEVIETLSLDLFLSEELIEWAVDV